MMMSYDRPYIKGVAEIVINVRDIARMQKFYEEVLGFAYHRQYPDKDPTIVFLTIADLDSPLGRGGHPQLFALIDSERHIYTKDTYIGIDNQRSSLSRFAFEIDEANFESEQQRLKDLGLETHTESFPDVQAKAIFFDDLEGNHLELICHHSGDSAKNYSKI